LEKVSDSLEVNQKRPNIFVIPGNHDIDRTRYKETRDLLRPLLLDATKNDDFLKQIKHTEPDTLKILYSPLTAFNEFAQPYFVDEISETIMMDEQKKHPFNDKNYYWKFTLGKEEKYTINLFGLNSTLTCDGNERAASNLKEEEGNHLTFLPKPAYNIQIRSNEINISMIHHPLDWFINERQITKIFDQRFQLQLFGHMHIQSSQSDKSIKIFSGALQPEQECDTNDCPPVYNLIEFTVNNATMNIKLESRKWDGSYFCKYEKESKMMSISLTPPDNWSYSTMEEAKKETAIINNLSTPINEINYRFIKSKHQKKIIDEIMPGTFNEDRSDRANSLAFLKAIKEKGIYQQLLNELNK